MKAPKEITESYPFIIHKGCVYQYKGEVPEGATVLNAPNIDTAMGYLSEESVKEMLAEKDKTIDNMSFGMQALAKELIEKDKEIIALKETILSQLNQAKIDSLNPQKDASKRGGEYRIGLCKAIDIVAYEFDALIHKQP